MANSYLYYKRSDEWVRVNADSSSREYEQNPGYFAGGQCEGVRYTVNYSYDNSFRGGSPSRETASQSRVRGPIEGIRVDNFGSTGVVIIEHATGTTNARVETSSRTVWSNPTIESVSREDGQPDNCGSMPAEGECSTVFKLNGLVVFTLSDCPEVTDGKDDCSDCCARLLPITKGISL